MLDRGGKSSNGVESSGAEAKFKVLAVSLSGAGGLGCEVQTVLRHAPNVELIREVPPLDGSPGALGALAGVLARTRPDLLLLCLPSGPMTGVEAVFDAVRNDRRELSLVAVLDTAAPDQLHRLFVLGAADFCLSPLRLEDLLPRLSRWSAASSRAGAITWQLDNGLGLQQFLGRSRVFHEAVNRIPKLARCDANVFITGETGTGKEMCARAIHHLSPRADHPFVPVNCGAIPSELVENELFGHDAGAFTSASSAVRGLVHDAEGGTLFLDEIDALPLQIQVKFLRFLQDQEYRPLGGRKTLRADLRIITASNADLQELVRARRFRSDLFYRLNVLPLKLPPLRERREDIPLLARHFASKCARESSMPARELSPAAMQKLLGHDWPGNVRELENIIERAVVLSERSLITGEDICLPDAPPCAEDLSFKALKAHAIAEFETRYIRRMLDSHEGNISKAARASKKNRRAFWQLMRKHEIAPSTVRAAR